uniref:Intraflagellar transport associated protein n=1 Tax=Capra hircus TaxID=9925 RepID=A0A8C2RMU7_CAPHI
MPAQTPELEMMDEDRLIEEVLDKFVNCHEQTYEEFLKTFTHLSKENVTKREAFGANSSENNFTSIKFTQRNEPNDHRLSNKAIFLRTSSQCSEEEQVDNFLDIEDLDLDEEINPQLSKDVLLLPGQVEQEVSLSVPSYIPSVAIQPVTPGTKPRPTVKAADKQREEIIGDEVQPFSLDEEFDYDAVVLTPKFTPAEMNAIEELSKQKTKSSDWRSPMTDPPRPLHIYFYFVLIQAT